jgi:hypothetical protein
MSTVDLEKIAKEIAADGAANDNALSLLSKGISDGFTKLAELIKGKAKMDEDEEGDEKEEGGDDDTDEKEEGGGDEPGYQDMDKAAPAADDTQTFDVTSFLLSTTADIALLRKASAAKDRQIDLLSKKIDRLSEQNSQLAGMIITAAEGNAAMLGPLAKAMADTRTALLNAPAAPITPSRFTNANRPPPALIAAQSAYIGGSHDSERVALAKALHEGVIDAHANDSWRKMRIFSTDAEHDAEMRAKVAALAPAPRT